MFLVPNIDQMYKEMKKIVEVGNKHGNGDEFPDFADLFFLHKNCQVVDRKHTYIFFQPNEVCKHVILDMHIFSLKTRLGTDAVSTSSLSTVD